MAVDGMAEGLHGMRTVGSPREPMGTSIVGHFVDACDTARGTMVPKTNQSKGGNGAGFGSFSPTGGADRPIMASKLGARYAIQVKLSGPRLPEATHTQANGRRMSPASRGGFRDERGYWANQ